MKEIFNVILNDKDKVILKVIAEDTLTIAMHPYINGDMDYITVTKGGKHILTIINKNGKTWSFSWGIGGYTLISDNTEKLRQEVVNYIGRQGISLEYRGEPVKRVNVYYNSFMKKWEINITPVRGGCIAHFSTIASSLEDIMEEADKLIPGGKGWEPWTSPNGHKSYIMIR